MRDEPTLPPRAGAIGPRADGSPQGRSGEPRPLPARAVTAFAARAGLPVEVIAAQLGLEGAQLLTFDHVGGPGWLRLALLGIAVELGQGPDALAWFAGREAAAAPVAPPGEEPP